LLRFPIVRIIIPGRKHVCAQHNAAFYLRSESFLPCLTIHLSQFRSLFRAKAIAHTIKSGQIRRSLGRGNDVVDGDGILRVRQFNLNNFGAELSIIINCALDGSSNLRIKTLAKSARGKPILKPRISSVSAA